MLSPNHSRRPALNMTFDPKDTALRDGTVRKGEFREMARDIVWKDRDARSCGRSVDTGGAISRAMEAAYRLGVAHGSDAGIDTPAPRVGKTPAGKVDSIAWNTIPPRSRGVFERIFRYNWIVLLIPSEAPWLNLPDRWACYWDWGERAKEGERFRLAQAFSRSTLAPIIRLGLMEEESSGDLTGLTFTPLAHATWAAAVTAGLIEDRRDDDA